MYATACPLHTRAVLHVEEWWGEHDMLLSILTSLKSWAHGTFALVAGSTEWPDRWLTPTRRAMVRRQLRISFWQLRQQANAAHLGHKVNAWQKLHVDFCLLTGMSFDSPIRATLTASGCLINTYHG